MQKHLAGYDRKVQHTSRHIVAWVVALTLGFGGSASYSQVPSTDQIQQLQQLRQSGTGATQGTQGVDQGQSQSVILQPATPQISVRPLQASRLEQIMSQRANVRLKQFGYEELGRGRSVTIPLTGAVQGDYILGPGDEVIVSLRGQENGEYRAQVDRNGQVVLPRLPALSASGRSLDSFRADLDAAVNRSYVATSASVSVGRVRQISVLVSGEVIEPGQRLLTGLSTAVDALVLSGGVKKTGSLRSVRIQRAGRTYNVDLYGVLTARGTGAQMTLQDGDRILVPPLGRTVAVAGLVRQPGIYELPAGAHSMSSSALLSLAGGQEVRGRYRLSVLRVLDSGQTQMQPLAGSAGVVRDSEVLFVQLGADQVTGQATLSGGSGLAGQYAIQSGTRLSDMLRAPGALGDTPYTLFGIIVRRNPKTYLRVPMPFAPVAVLNGRDDRLLQSDDVVRVLSVNEAAMLNFVVQTYLGRLASEQAKIRNPLTANVEMPTQNQASLANQLGGDTSRFPGIDPNNPARLAAQAQAQTDDNQLGLEALNGTSSEAQRNEIIRLLDVAPPGTELGRRQKREFLAQINQAITDSATAPTAITSGSAAATTTPGGALSATGSNSDVSGQSSADDTLRPALPQQQQQAGTNDLYSQNPSLPPNFIEQPITPGGIASNREARTFGELAQQLHLDPLVLINFLVENRARIEGAVAGPGYYLVGPNALLDDLVQAAGGTTNWADQSGVELTSTVVDPQTGRSDTQRQILPLHKGVLASYMVRPQDQFRFARVYTDAGLGTVTVQGEVRAAGTFAITRGEHLSDLLMRAGGLTPTAYPQGTVFLRKSAAAVERSGYLRAADEVQQQLLVGMTRVGNDKIPPETFTAMQNFINQLRSQKAMGRVPFVADPAVLAANPESDPLLEPGDAVYIPQRPSTVSVLGEVMQPGSYIYQSGAEIGDYIRRAGGYAQYADESLTFVVLPDGTARRIEQSWLHFNIDTLPPGSSIVVPRDLTPIDTRQVILDVTSILSGLAVSLASVAVLAK